MILSIGHSNHAIGKFIGLLKDAGVDLVADVRSKPVSRYCPQFNKAALTQSLKEAGIGYLYLGAELGGRPDGGKPDYAAMRNGAAFQTGIEMLLREAGAQRVALMCAEKDPKDCHRFHLIGKHLAGMGVEAQHILSDGRMECHSEVEIRAGGTADLFHS